MARAFWGLTWSCVLGLSTALSACGASSSSKSVPSEDAGPDALGSGGGTGGTASGGTSNGGGGAGTDGGAGGGTAAGASTDGGLIEDASDGSALPSCPRDAGPEIVATGFRIVPFSAGQLLVQPNAMVFGADGKMYVANSHSLISGAGDQGEVLAIEPTGAQASFATDNLMRGPDGVAFGAPGDGGGLGPLLVAVEDDLEANVRTTDAILQVESGSTSVLFDAYEPSNLLRGPGGAFGSDLYYAARTDLTGGPPNALRLFRRDDSGTGGVFTVTGGDGGEILGAAFFSWSTGGTLGTDLYLATVADVPYTPVSADAVFRVQADGRATHLASYRATGLAGSPDASGPYGDYIYALGASTLDRIDASGTVTPILMGLTQPNGIVFGPDGVLYVADTGAQRIVKVEPCAP